MNSMKMWQNARTFILLNMKLDVLGNKIPVRKALEAS